MYRKLRWGRWRGCRLRIFACISTVPHVKLVILRWIGYLYSLLAQTVCQKMSRTESWNGDEGVSFSVVDLFEYFKYFSDLKVCIYYSVCEEPFSCLFILLVFIRESLRKMQHFHLEKNINLAFFQNCSVSFQTLLYTCLCILLDRNTGSIKCTHACICVYIFTQKS